MLKGNYYDDIDEFPWWNWKRCQKGQIEYTRKDLDKGTEEEDNENWEKLYDSYLKEFGLGKDYEYYFELKAEKAILECRMVYEENLFLQNRINVLELKIKELLDRGSKQGDDKIIVYLSKWMGAIINEKTTSVKMVYQMLKAYEEEAQHQKNQSNG